MADVVDIADKQYEKVLDAQIDAARTGGVFMPGPAQCVQCGYPNDRRDEGYGVCSDCMQGGDAA